MPNTTVPPEDAYEHYERLLRIVADTKPEGWVNDLQGIRKAVDQAHDAGALATYQWQALVSTSARIQDRFNDERMNEIKGA